MIFLQLTLLCCFVFYFCWCSDAMPRSRDAYA